MNITKTAITTNNGNETSSASTTPPLDTASTASSPVSSLPTRSNEANQSTATTDTVTEKERQKWKTHSTPQDCSFIPTLGVTLWLGWNGLLLYLGVYLILFASQLTRAVVLGLCTLSLLLPRDFPGALGYKMGDWMMIQAEKYFGLKTLIEDEDSLKAIGKSDKAAIFAFEPHDILPYPVFCFNPVLKRIPGKIGETGHCLMSSAVFYVPFMRQVYTWVQGSPIDRKTFKGRLQRGESFAFVPGGVQEVTLMDPNKPDDLVLYLQSRKGFIKLALATGSPIIPVFGFHVDGSYGFWIMRGSWFNRVARIIGFAPLVFWGRFLIPFGIPRPKSIHVVVGKPIHVPFEGDNIQDTSVEKYHALFLKELDALFERHKVDEGYGHKKLKIL